MLSDVISVKEVIDEDCTAYALPSMIITLQNINDIQEKPDEYSISELCYQYFDNKKTRAIVFDGYEPFNCYKEVTSFIYRLRITFKCNDVIVINTKYKKHEILDKCIPLSFYGNIIVVYGEYAELLE